MPDYDEKFNVILLGDIDVGKTSLLLRFSEQKFVEDFEDIEQKQRDLTIDGKVCRIVLTDTAGQEKFRTLTSSFFRNASAMIFVYDITNEESFKNVEGHFQDGSRYTKQALRFLVGNKADLIKKRVITESQGQELAESFTGIATMLLERAQRDDDDTAGKPKKKKD